MLPVFWGCKKTAIYNGPVTPYKSTVTAMINDTSVSFNASITVDTSSTPGTIYIVAHSDTANFTPLLEITIVSGGASVNAVKPGTYTDTSSLTQGILGYTTWSGASDEQFANDGDTVSVQSISNTGVMGSFQGTCEFIADTIPVLTKVSNGKFNVGFMQK